MEALATEHRVKNIVVKFLGVTEDEVAADKSFADDLGADSLDIADMLVAMESEFRVDISERDAERIRTVGDVVAYIDARAD